MGSANFWNDSCGFGGDNVNYSLFGYGISNQALAKYLIKSGQNVFVSDKNNIPLSQRIEGVEYEFGNSDRILEADTVVVSPSIKPTNPIILKAKKRNIEVVSDIELFYRLFKPKMIAITGTNGKTTTTSLINSVLQKKYVSYLAGNIGKPIFELADIDCDFIVVEISSFQLHYTQRLKPFISILLNITPDHIDWHGSFDKYKEDKYKIFKNQDEEDYAIIKHGLDSLKIKAKKITFSLTNKSANYQVVNNDIFEDGKPIFEVETKLKGRHNLENILATVAVGRICNVSKELIAEAIFDFNPLEHRLEIVDKIDGVEFINDSKSTTTDSTLKAVEAYNDSILILGGRRKGENYKDFVKKLKNMVKAIVLIGESTNDFKDYCEEYSIKYITAIDMCEAVQKAFETAKKYGTNVLLSPATASYDMFSNYRMRGETFKNCVTRLNNSKSF